MSFTVSDIKALRERTGCGMMDCKKALTEADGNMDKAIEALRERGLAAAAKKSSRTAAEGLVVCATSDDGETTAIIEVNAETDFVTKNEQFIDFVNVCAQTVLANEPADVEALLECKATDGSGFTVAELVREKILTIGENMNVRRFEIIKGTTSSYIHAGGSIGVVVKFDTDGVDTASDDFKAYGKDMAMQVAAANPSYINKDEVPQDVIDGEKNILLSQIENDPKLAAKPDMVKEKMVTGKIGKFLKEVCLLDQQFVKDSDFNVEKYTAKIATDLGGTIAINSFVRYEKGEGLAKREDNFADEVANMIK